MKVSTAQSLFGERSLSQLEKKWLKHQESSLIEDHTETSKAPFKTSTLLAHVHLAILG